ncbi:unnamed protein product, partial [Urochloa humidicola]
RWCGSQGRPRLGRFSPRGRATQADRGHRRARGQGAGAGGVLAAMLFLRGPDGRSRCYAQETLALVAGSVGRKNGGGRLNLPQLLPAVISATFISQRIDAPSIASPSFSSPGDPIKLFDGEVKVLVPKSTTSPNKSSLTCPGKQLQLQVQMDWCQ